MSEIDYISSVSGGSWANGAYVSAPESDQTFFNCLSQIAAMGKIEPLCKGFENVLSYKQNQIKGSGDWQKQIIDHSLRGKDMTFDALHEQKYTDSKRPFPIFLATHSNTLNEKKSRKNFPFEFTPISIAAVADCKSLGVSCGFFRKYFRPLHWSNAPEKGFVIDTTLESGFETQVKKYNLYNNEKDLYLSHAMWASGGLIAKALSLHLHLDMNGEKISGVRDKYVLSDGGKVDNVGLIPLVERGANLIILSQIASDKKMKFMDLQRSSNQVKKLFGMKVDTDPLIKPHKQDLPPIVSASCIRGANNNPSSIMLIKPTTDNIAGFTQFLAHSKYHKLNETLEQEASRKKLTRFPQNATVKLKYPKELMYLYFALGEYIGTQVLSQEINQWLENGTQCS